MTVKDKQVGFGLFSPNGYRWRICALLFFATVINYIDRQVLGILAPQLQAELNWSDSEYGLIVTTFQVAYAIGFLFMGRMMDYLGSRIGYSISVGFWSIATLAHAFANSIIGFGAVRFALGLGEAGNFPAAVKTSSEWFPKVERSFVNGIFVSGASIGAIIAPLMVPVIAIHMGWRWAFILTGILGFIWLISWSLTYHKPRSHPKLSAEELAYIESDPEEQQINISWKSLLGYKQTWAFALAKFFTDPVFSFFFFFLPKFLYTSHGVTLDKLGIPLMVIYIMSDVGSIVGGWTSSYFLKRGWSVNASRKTTMLMAAICVPFVYFASVTTSLWTAVGLIGFALAAHQAWSANLFTLPSDIFPQKVVASVVGVGSTLGAIGGMFGAATAGFLLESTGGYRIHFIVASVVYLIALAIIHGLVPTIKMIQMDEVLENKTKSRRRSESARKCPTSR